MFGLEKKIGAADHATPWAPLEHSCSSFPGDRDGRQQGDLQVRMPTDLQTPEAAVGVSRRLRDGSCT